jgi:hypothetical protein
LKINGIETGQRGIRTRELRELLDTYGADPALADALAALARPRRGGADWWSPYVSALPAPTWTSSPP